MKQPLVPCESSEAVVVVLEAVVEELAGEGEEEVAGDEDEEEDGEEHPGLHVDPQGDLLHGGPRLKDLWLGWVDL